MSKAANIALALTSRLASIAISGNYQTDIGARVYRGRRRLDENSLPCTVLIESDDTPQVEKLSVVKLEQRYIIEGHAACDPDNPNDTALAMIADIKRSIWSVDDDTLGGLVMNMNYVGRIITPREDGLAIVAAAVELVVVYVEQLANP